VNKKVTKTHDFQMPPKNYFFISLDFDESDIDLFDGLSVNKLEETN